MAAHLDWTDRKHWGDGRARRCIYCDVWTPLLDTGGRPAHKQCAEHMIDLMREQKRQRENRNRP